MHVYPKLHHQQKVLFVACEKRPIASAVIITILLLTCACTPLLGLDERQTALNRLRVKADQAQPRARCFLYAELVSQMTDLASQQFSSGNSEEASETLDQVRQYAEKIHLGVDDDGRKLKNAELLLQRTVFRLKDILQEAPYEDRPVLQATLEKVNQVEVQLLTQVLKK
jgi:hypothetical protein